MNTEKKILGSIIQLDNGSNYEVVESTDFIRSLIADEFIKDNSFLTFHFPDGYECNIRKDRISAYYENDE